MQHFRPTSPSQGHEETLAKLVDAISLPTHLIERADQSWKSAAEWIDRVDGPLAQFDPHVTPQGSFLFGTAIRPVGDEEAFDADGVVLLRALETHAVSQEWVKREVHLELERYRRARSMLHPVEDNRRCSTLIYQAKPRFRIDYLPALRRGPHPSFLTHTDRKCPWFEVKGKWPSITAPMATANWLKGRMRTIDIERGVATMRRRGQPMATRDNLPVRWVRSPLTDAIKLLKRHAAALYEGDPDRPIPAITLVLAGRAYSGQDTISGSLMTILPIMRNFIEWNGEVGIVRNPGCPDENFADKWLEKPRKQKLYLEWLARAERDFLAFMFQDDPTNIPAGLEEGLTRISVDRALGLSQPSYLRSMSAMLAAEVQKVSAEGRDTKPWLPD